MNDENIVKQTVEKSDLVTSEVQEKETPTPQKSICVQCKAQLPPDMKYCPHCGKKVEPIAPPQPPRCIRCGTTLPTGTSFCPHCGKSVKKSNKLLQNTDNKKILIVAIAFAALILIFLTVSLILLFNYLSVESVSLSESEITLLVGKSQTVTYTVNPGKIKNDNKPKFKSSDEKIATVDDTGKITANAEGECVITVKVGAKKDTLRVTVKSIDFQELFDAYCHEEWATLGSDGSFLAIDTNPYNRSGAHDAAAYAAIRKITPSLGLPDSFLNDLLHTSYDMGKQTEHFDDVGISVTWMFHPDKGMEITYKLSN